MEKNLYLVTDEQTLPLAAFPDSSNMIMVSLGIMRDPESLDRPIERVRPLMQKETAGRLISLLHGVDSDNRHSLNESLADACQWDKSGNRVHDILKRLGVFRNATNGEASDKTQI